MGIGADKHDAVSFEANENCLIIRSVDGLSSRSVWATLSLPTARKLAIAILKAVDAAEGK